MTKIVNFPGKDKDLISEELVKIRQFKCPACEEFLHFAIIDITQENIALCNDCDYWWTEEEIIDIYYT